MSGPDLQAEYDNRARVPEHPAIIAGWARDAASYREAAGARYSVRPYGPGDRQALHAFAPESPAEAATVLFVHGGYWRSLDPTLFSHLARGLNARGIAVAMPGYELCPGVPLSAIVDQVRAACLAASVDGRPVVAAGHSAGGHLAACLLATDWGAAGGAPAGLVPSAYAISGLFDLTPLLATDVNEALRLDEAEARRLSPLGWPPPRGRSLDAVAGGAESAEYLRQSRSIAEAWGAAGVATRCEAVPGANHFTVVAPLADPASPMTARLAELALASPVLGRT